MILVNKDLLEIQPILVPLVILAPKGRRVILVPKGRRVILAKGRRVILAPKGRKVILVNKDLLEIQPILVPLAPKGRKATLAKETLAPKVILVLKGRKAILEPLEQ